MQIKIDNSLKKGLGFLSQTQKSNGSFISLSSLDPLDFSRAKKVKSNFLPILILESLNHVKNTPQVRKIKQKLAKFILSQKTPHWSWNYWSKNSPESKKFTLPDDLDDTFCALAGLYNHDPKIITGRALSKITKLLTTLEIKEGGPYKTWLVPNSAEKTWQDVDLAVNINIGYFLSMIGVDLPSINELIESTIKTKSFHSKYYDKPLTIIYFISRWYKGTNKKQIVNFIFSLQKKDGSWGTTLNTALAIISLKNLNFNRSMYDKSLNFIISHQNKDGSWPITSFFPDLVVNNKSSYAGSSALTTAFCIEALSEFKSKKIKEDASIIYKKIIDKIKNIFSHLEIDAQKQSQVLLKKLIKIDSDKYIGLLPFFFIKSLSKNHQKKISEKITIKLGIANLLGWMAYTVYDDFLDDEGDKKSLSIANVCLREMTLIFSKILTEKDIKKVFRKYLNFIDSANAWEITHCRFSNNIVKKSQIPDFSNYKKLAYKSIGHALGPIIILLILGFPPESAQTKNITKFFTHYLIARQLDDDAHDWETDLKLGQINPISAILLKKYFTKNKKQKIILNNKNLEKLKKLFWHEVIDEISQLILNHCKQAQKYLEKNKNIIKDKTLFIKLLNKHKNSAHLATQEKNKILQFLKDF